MNDSALVDRLDLNLFRVFAAVFRTGSTTAAAAQLHLTQPAVSNALARLRQELDDPLFLRAGRRMAPTPRARAIAPTVMQALEALSEASRGQSHFAPADATRRFQLGLRDLPEVLLLPELLAAVQREAPGVRLLSRAFERARLERLLASGELDLAIDIPIHAGDAIASQSLIEDPFCLVLRRGHPAARRPLSEADWRALPHVVVSARPSGPVLEDLLMPPTAAPRDVLLRCQHYAAACRVVAETDAALLLPQRYAELQARALGLVVRRPPIELPPVALHLYWHRDADGDPGLAWLRQRIAARFASAAVTSSGSARPPRPSAGSPATRRSRSYRRPDSDGTNHSD